ncbi:phosphoglucan water dikinase, partial [Trifolium medium]|nr:phosphoglucan water dikinase [Trifolium medium]
VREGGKTDNNTNNKDTVHLHLRLDHQVQFGDHVVLLGSTKELGSWKTNVPLNWTQNGWVRDFHFKGGDHLQFKFIIVNQDGTLLWEAGDNRVLNLPATGTFQTVATWNTTHQILELLPFNEQQQQHSYDHDSNNLGDNNHDKEAVTASPPPPPSEAGSSPFVGEWQGKSISFMQSNEHQSHEAQRTWDTSGLQGLPLKLVQGDQSARNWWRKVPLCYL